MGHLHGFGYKMVIIIELDQEGSEGICRLECGDWKGYSKQDKGRVPTGGCGHRHRAIKRGAVKKKRCLNASLPLTGCVL